MYHTKKIFGIYRFYDLLNLYYKGSFSWYCCLMLKFSSTEYDFAPHTTCSAAGPDYTRPCSSASSFPPSIRPTILYTLCVVILRRYQRWYIFCMTRFVNFEPHYSFLNAVQVLLLVVKIFSAQWRCFKNQFLPFRSLLCAAGKGSPEQNLHHSLWILNI